ncbi:MAG: hypothetical protein ACREVI_05525 [Steroidobacteraceae bacterium]
MTFLLTAMLWLAGCKAGEPAGPATTRQATTDSAITAEVTAIVRFLDVEGGCWALDTPQGSIQPLSLPPQFQSDGMRVRVSLRATPDMMSVCQVGPSYEVISISEE